MTYRELFFELKNSENEYVTNHAIKELLLNDGGFSNDMELYKHFDETVSNEVKLYDQITRIKNGEPFQYVLGKAFFIDRYYQVTKDVLIPRQETELLALLTLETIQRYFPNKKDLVICDVGTGSGILAIYLKSKLNSAKVIATDISKKALEIAKRNANIYKNSIDLRCCNMLDEINEKLDVIIANPPYIPTQNTVSEQTLKYEPHLALFASPATKYYEEILSPIHCAVCLHFGSNRRR